jgi:hypothetical protein
MRPAAALIKVLAQESDFSCFRESSRLRGLRYKGKRKSRMHVDEFKWDRTLLCKVRLFTQKNSKKRGKKAELPQG